MQRLTTLIERYPDLSECHGSIKDAYQLLELAYADDGQVLVCGNGGSAADSEHIVAELMKGFALPRAVPASVRERLALSSPETGSYLADHLQGALRAVSLVSQTSLATAFSNDVAPDMAFAQQVYGYGRPGDVVWGISTSGNSANVVHALEVGRALGLRTLGLTGRDGGALAACCDVVVRVPYVDTAAVQERHVAVYHALCLALEARFFGP
ncbi:D-sedoheptulose-7-phosphate isomerase [Rubrivirga sp.]|uniref:D-sedoheptulose-7-phosphate isomerase n=1 Tax=Rubrivirga sp. TaxID=1885344 RepID=UPI003B52E351